MDHTTITKTSIEVIAILKIRRRKRNEERLNLINSRTNEFTAKNNVTKQDSEIAARFRMLRLFVQYETCYGHQICALCICDVVHFFFQFQSFNSIINFPTFSLTQYQTQFSTTYKTLIYKYACLASSLLLLFFYFYFPIFY